MGEAAHLGPLPNGLAVLPRSTLRRWLLLIRRSAFVQTATAPSCPAQFAFSFLLLTTFVFNRWEATSLLPRGSLLPRDCGSLRDAWGICVLSRLYQLRALCLSMTRVCSFQTYLAMTKAVSIEWRRFLSPCLTT